MGLESATYIHQLDIANPSSTDQVQQADDHLRLIKSVLKATFPNLTGSVSSTQAQLNGSLVPVGLISAWFGNSTSVPSGWAICNGQTVTKSDGSGTIVTPDLRDRVVIGAGTVAAQGVAVGGLTPTTSADGAHAHITDAQGNHAHNLAINGTALDASQIPPHSHYVAYTGAGSSDTGVAPNNPIASNRGLGGNADYILVAAGAGPANSGLSSSVGSGATHSHSGVTDAQGNHAHNIASSGAHAHAFSPLQPSYGLHMIMKV